MYASSHTVSYFEASTETSHVAFLQTHLKAPPLSKQKVSVTTEITDASSTKMHTVSNSSGAVLQHTTMLKNCSILMVSLGTGSSLTPFREK